MAHDLANDHIVDFVLADEEVAILNLFILALVAIQNVLSCGPKLLILHVKRSNFLCVARVQFEKLTAFLVNSSNRLTCCVEY